MSVLSIPEALLHEIEELNARAWDLNRENPNEAIELANKALSKSSEINYTKGIALAKKTLGACYIWTSRNDEGVEYCMQANELFKSLKDKKNGAVVYINLGTNFYFLSDYETALKCYKTSYDLNAKIAFEPGMADALNGIGTVNYTIEQNEKALESLLESEKLCKKHKINGSLAKVQDGLGETYYNLKKYDQSLLYYNSAMRISKEITNSHMAESYALDGMGRTYVELEDYNKALDCYEKSLAIRRDIGFKVGEANIYSHMGELYLRKKDVEKATEYLIMAFELASKIGSKESVFKSSEKLAELYEQQNRPEEALKYYKIYHAAKEDVRNIKSAQLSKSFELQNRVLQTVAERTILEERAKELENFTESLTLMSQVGQQIISSLSVETIVNTAYKSINSLMDATGFGIGLVKPEDKSIVFPLYIEGDETFENIRYDITDTNRLTVLCYHDGKDIIINDFVLDVGKYIQQNAAPKAGKTVESIIYLPLNYKDERLGVITVQSFTKNAYTNYHVNILRNLATYTAIALANAKLYQEQEQTVQQRTQELLKSKEEIERSYQVNKKINEIGRHITSNLNLGDIFKELYSNLNEIMSVECFGVRIYRPENNTVEYKFEMERGEVYDDVHVVPLTDDDNYTVWCIKNRKDIFLNDNRKEYSKYVKQIRVVSGDMPNSLMFTPMIIGEKLIGVITVQSFSYNAYQPQHLDMLRTLATYTATALENAWLYENMEEKVNERTKEVVKQKEEIEKTYEHTRLLGKIGNDITSTFSIEEILEKVYSNVNSLMDATGFGIGVYKKDSEEIVFPLYIEGEDRFVGIADKLSDKHMLSCICLTRRQEIFINDWKRDIVKYREDTDDSTPHGKSAASLIYLPLYVKENVVGVITVQSFNKNTYTDYHLQILKSLGVYVAIAIDNANLYSGMEDRVKERTREIEKNYNDTRLIGEISKELSSSLSVETIVSSVYNHINMLMKAEAFGIALYNKENKCLDFKGFIENGQKLDDFSLPVEGSDRLGAICFNKQEEIVINDFEMEYKRYLQAYKAPITGNVSLSIVYLPLYAKAEIIGVLTVQSTDKNAYSPYIIDILKNLTVSIGIALDNASLYKTMEEKVNERTQEVVRQKEEIEKTFENARIVSEIGKEISSTFSISEIIGKVYNNINRLMDATMLGIGIFDEKTQRLYFNGAIEEGVILEDWNYELSNIARPAVQCYVSQQEVVINSFTDEYVKTNKIATRQSSLPGKHTESIIYLPLTQNGKKIGVITVQSFNINAYTDYHIQIVKSLAIYTAIALDNASLYNEMEERVNERTAEISTAYQNTKLLSEVAEDISSSLSLETVISKVHANVNKFMKADCFGIGLLNKTGDLLEFNGFMEKGVAVESFSFQVSDANRLATQCLLQQKEIFISDYSIEYSQYIKGIQAPVSGQDSASIIYLPIYSKDEVIGVLTVQSYEKNAYTEYHFNILKNLAVSIAIALDNASLYQNLEEKVNERTQEVIAQKEQIEKTFENTRLVSEIGKEITSTFSIEDIISKVYESVNKLMDGTVFGIGIYNESIGHIVFEGVIEKGERLDRYSYSLKETERPAVACYVSQKDYIINNYSTTQAAQKVVAKAGELPEGIIYVPVTQGAKRIGVITVQSFKRDAYTDYHLQLLKSLAVYAAIAIDNASLYTSMEDRVRERTDEITKAYENTRLLSQIAEDISASLSVETITGKLYENVNKLMDATMFGIGVHNPTNNNLEFKGFVENNETMPDFYYKADDPNRLAAYCFVNKTEILINDYSVEYIKYIKGMKKPVSGKDSSSIVYIPLYSKGKIIGVFTVQSFVKDAYSDYQLNILKNLAVSIGIALDNANLYQNLEEKVKERTDEVIKQKDQLEKTFEDQRTLTKIGNDITSTLSIEEIIDKVYAKITSLMDAMCFGVGLYNKETSRIVYPLYIEGEDKFSSMVYDMTERDKITYLCYNNNRDIVINDFEQEIELYVPRVKSQMQGGMETQSLIFLPMVLKEKVIGVITVQSMNVGAYSDYHVQILKNLAVYVAIAIDNAKLYQNMEDMVAERTREVTKQKELLEKNFNDVKLSAEIAKDIASSLSVETIVSRVYENLQSIVKAESFGIGLYNPETDTIGFSGFIEKGEKLPFVQVTMDDKERYAVMCFEQEIEIIINDHKKEYSRYTKEFKKSLVGDTPESLVYLPLYTKEKKIGVLTAQCFTKDEFQDFQVNILKNMALSIAIALDNANLYQNLELKVEERTAEVHKQKAIIEEKNKDITDSIKYAKKIQQAIAPNIEEFNRNFTDSFILYKPKDIVSGDFYWFDHFENNTTVFAAADCTGHGVPGAFMSLINSDIMYKVINDQKEHSPGKALNLIDERLVSLIKKSSESSANDGMDIALCTYHKNDKKLLYAGAHRPLLLIRNKQIIEFKPSKFSIGGHSTEGKRFELNEIDVQPGDVFYLLTDGYADQFGGDNGKKFKFKNFKELVLSVSHEPMKDQRRILDETFENWKGTLEQIDDVCVIGIKI